MKDVRLFTPAGGLLVLAVVVVAVAVTWFGGLRELRGAVSALEIMNARQDGQIEELMRRNEALMVDRTMAERRLEVSNQTLEYLREMLQTREIELRDSQEELGLFRKITGPDRIQGLGIHTLEVFALGEGRWRWRLVLYQGDFSRVAEGHYDLALHGHAAGEPVRHHLSALVEEEVAQTFSFYHFEVLGGEFRLPEAFTAERVEVQVFPDGGKREDLIESFSWRQVLADSG